MKTFFRVKIIFDLYLSNLKMIKLKLVIIIITTLTLCTESGVLKSLPPWRRNPQEVLSPLNNFTVNVCADMIR